MLAYAGWKVELGGKLETPPGHTELLYRDDPGPEAGEVNRSGDVGLVETSRGHAQSAKIPECQYIKLNIRQLPFIQDITKEISRNRNAGTKQGQKAKGL